MTRLEGLLPLLTQDDLPRTGWVLRGVAPAESVAGHVLGVGQIALALAPEVEPPLDLARVLAMALVHDLPEAASGDLPRSAARALPKGAKAAMEAKLAAELLVPLGTGARAAWEEYRERTSREARFVHLCDRLQLGLRLVGYERRGHLGLAEFREGLRGLPVEGFAPCAALLAEILQAGSSQAAAADDALRHAADPHQPVSEGGQP